MPMPKPVIPAPTRRFRAKRRAATTPPPATPTLVAATYEDSDFVTLTFDRAVDVTDIDTATIFVDDELIAGRQFQGATPVTQASATSVTVALNPLGAATGTGMSLSVDAGNGIASVAGGAAWAGCSEVALPFSN